MRSMKKMMTIFTLLMVTGSLFAQTQSFPRPEITPNSHTVKRALDSGYAYVSFRITNTFHERTSFTISPDDSWLSTNYSIVSLSPGESRLVQIKIDTGARLNLGSNRGFISIGENYTGVGLLVGYVDVDLILSLPTRPPAGPGSY